MSRKLKQWPPPPNHNGPVSYADLLTRDSPFVKPGANQYIDAGRDDLFLELVDEPGDLFFAVYYDEVSDRFYTGFDGNCSLDSVELCLERNRGKL